MPGHNTRHIHNMRAIIFLVRSSITLVHWRYTAAHSDSQTILHLVLFSAILHFIARLQCCRCPGKPISFDLWQVLKKITNIEKFTWSIESTTVMLIAGVRLSVWILLPSSHLFLFVLLLWLVAFLGFDHFSAYSIRYDRMELKRSYIIFTYNTRSRFVSTRNLPIGGNFHIENHFGWCVQCWEGHALSGAGAAST